MNESSILVVVAAVQHCVVASFFLFCLLIISSRLLASTIGRSVCLSAWVLLCTCTSECVCVEFNCHKIIKKKGSRFGCFQYVSKLNSISL